MVIRAKMLVIFGCRELAKGYNTRGSYMSVKTATDSIQATLSADWPSAIDLKIPDAVLDCCTSISITLNCCQLVNELHNLLSQSCENLGSSNPIIQRFGPPSCFQLPTCESHRASKALHEIYFKLLVEKNDIVVSRDVVANLFLV